MAISSQQATSQPGEPGQGMDPAHENIHMQFPDAIFILSFSAGLWIQSSIAQWGHLMEKQRRTEYKTSYKQIHACPPTLTTNPRSIGTKLHRLKVCMRLSLAPSGLRAYLPSFISPALSVLHSLHLMNLSHHLCTLLQLQRLIDILDSAVQEWFQHFQLWEAHPRSGRQEGWTWGCSFYAKIT